MTVSRRAAAAFSEGNWALAVSLYERAAVEHPRLAHLYHFNLTYAKKQLAGARKFEVNADSEAAALDGCPSANRPAAERSSAFLKDLYSQVYAACVSLPPLTGSLPKVSLLMTTHNVAKYVEAAITSVLRQSWPNLELIVVDDASADETWAILQRLQKSVANIQCRRLNSNLGTYFAKNYALQLAKGEYIFFQDGDDLSHPERVRLLMLLLQQRGVVCVQGAYSRVEFPSGRVMPINGQTYKRGLVTLGVRRHVFEHIGYFNCTSKASDDEFFQRLQRWARESAGKIAALDLPLYYNTFREGSLFADMICNDPVAEGHIEQQPSHDRQDYVQKFSTIHREVPASRLNAVFQFPRIRDAITVRPAMSLLANPQLPVIASLCSIPERVDLLRRCVASLARQVDELHVYLDRYESAPAFLRECHPKLTVRFSKEYPNLRDNGKFIPLRDLADDCYFLTVDDDIEYPPDYVNTLLKKIEFYGRAAVVGVHGVIIPENPVGYYSGFRRVHWFAAELERDQLVNNLGTGTMAFHTRRLRDLDYRSFEHSGMVDLYVGAFCKDRGIPMVAVSRHQNWLVEMKLTSTHGRVAPTLFAEGWKDDAKQTQLIRRHMPWGYSAITRAVDETADQLPVTEGSDAAVQRLRELLPALSQSFW